MTEVPIGKEFRSVPERPYDPGWLDRLLDRIDGMPGSNGFYALGLLAFQATWVTVALWWNGTMRSGRSTCDRRSSWWWLPTSSGCASTSTGSRLPRWTRSDQCSP